MNDEITLADIFGDEESKGPSKAYQQLSGLKLSGTHTSKLNVDGKEVEFPTYPYVKTLEEQIRELRKELRQAEAKIKQLTTQVIRMNNTIQKNNNKDRTYIDMGD